MNVSLIIRLSRLGSLVALALVIAVLRPSFLQPENLVNVVRQSSLQFLLAAGLTLTILTAGIDLSVASVLALSACLGGYLMTAGFPVPAVILLCLAAGVAVGLVNGAMITYVRIPPFIASYGMLWIAQGAANLVMQGQIFYGFPAGFRWLGAGSVLGIPVPILLAAGGLLALHLLVNRTPLGREYLYLGANARAAITAGVREDRVIFTAYCISGLMAALAGLIFIARLDAAEATISENMLLPAIASVVIGGTSLAGGFGSVTGTLVGSVIVTLITNGMNLLGISALWQPFVVGLVTVGAVFNDQWMRQWEVKALDRGSARKPGKSDEKSVAKVS